MKNHLYVFVLVIVLFATKSTAAPLTIEWALDVTSKYDYLSGSYVENYAPIQSTLTTSFENEITSVVDYGLTTITTFGGLLGTSWNSPITSQIGANPYGDGIENPYNSYTFPNVSDYSSSFIEEAASQKNVYNLSPDGTTFWAYHVEIRAQKRSDTQGGLGTADYSFTTDSLVDFYLDFQADGLEAYFNESYQLYDRVNDISLAGFSWSGRATIQNVAYESAPVPEPSTLILLILGMASLFILRRNKRG